MMKNNTNYFFVNRVLLHSDRWLSETFTRGQAWVDLFGLAQHTKGFFRVRGIKIEVERGQLGYSQVTLSKRWHWSRNKVRRYLKELEKNGDITLKTKHQNVDITTIITIVEYDLWQGGGTPNETPEGHQKDTKRYTYKNVKNEKKNIHSPLARDLSDYFIQQVKKIKDVDYMFSGGRDGSSIKSFLSKKGAPPYKQLVNFYLGHEKSERHLSMSSCLSVDTINQFNLKNTDAVQKIWKSLK